MGELRAEVDVVRAPLDRVEVLAEALPGPVDPLVEHGAGNVLDPSMSEMRRSCASGRTGAKPTPQLPMTAVVTPCQLDGVMRSSHVACPS